MHAVWYIHGAHSSPRSFAWLKDNLPKHQQYDVEYGHTRSVMKVVDFLAERVSHERKPITLIGHSLGGLIALNLSHRVPGHINKVVTIASPLGGVSAASVLRWIVPVPLIVDVHPSSQLVSQIRFRPPPVPTLSLVATAGTSPLFGGPNDGVVTIASQTCIEGPTYVSVSSNHFEILLSENTAKSIVAFVF